MEIQSVKFESMKLAPMMLTAPSMMPLNTPSSSKSTWRKFSSETPYLIDESFSTDETIDFNGFIERIRLHYNAKNYDLLLKDLELLEEQYLPAAGAIIVGGLLIMKSKCYEELGQMDLALAETEKAIDLLEVHMKIYEQLMEEGDPYHPFSLLHQRRAGLLLLNGREEEGFAELRAYQPTSVATALLYRLIEKERNVSLLKPQPLGDDYNLEMLFLAGRYEEVLEKAESASIDLEMRAAALAMLGRTEEAVQLCNRDEDGCDNMLLYDLIQALNGNKDSLQRWSFDLETEIANTCPIAPFAKWLASK